MLHLPTAEKAGISEIFSSLQGEGPCSGQKHIFVRFAECHIHCKYCDELDKPANEISRGEVLSSIQSLERDCGPHEFVSFTGGEPLLYISFLKPLMREVKSLGMKTYLETDGILYPALEKVLPLCDYISMDLKPASVTGERSFVKEHMQFLQLAHTKEMYVKIVASKEIDFGEFRELVAVIKSVSRKIPLVIQPVSSEIEGHEDVELMNILHELMKDAAESLNQVSIMPRLHKMMNIR